MLLFLTQAASCVCLLCTMFCFFRHTLGPWTRPTSRKAFLNDTYVAFPGFLPHLRLLAVSRIASGAYFSFGGVTRQSQMICLPCRLVCSILFYFFSVWSFFRRRNWHTEETHLASIWRDRGPDLANIIL